MIAPFPAIERLPGDSKVAAGKAHVLAVLAMPIEPFEPPPGIATEFFKVEFAQPALIAAGEGQILHLALPTETDRDDAELARSLPV